MARGINKVILVGNLGADPEVRYLASGDPVANISLATSESWKDKATGQNQERTEWHRVVIYGKMAEIASKYMKKGTKAYIEGSLRTRKWQDKNGQERYTTEIVCQDLQLLDSKGVASDESYAPSHSGEYGSKRSSSDSHSVGSYHPLSQSDLDEELPF